MRHITMKQLDHNEVVHNKAASNNEAIHSQAARP